MTIQKMAELGQPKRNLARVFGVSEGAVRYHIKRKAEDAVDGRSLRPQLAVRWADCITEYVVALEGEGPVNLAAMHDWLVSECAYTGSLRSLQRYCAKHFPPPKRRARRRVETPPGAQAQADWAEWPRVWIEGRCVYAYEFHLRLSHSRFGARVWSPRCDQLAWHQVHNEAFRRLSGIPATVRIDNLKTGVSRGAGSWGELNRSYRAYARTLRFHIDPCPVRQPRAKGKVERGIRGDRLWKEVTKRQWSSWDELQTWTDERTLEEAHRRICPATGTTVHEAWQAELAKLSALPLLPEPFDLVVTRPVADDCLVSFEGRQYSVPFAHIGRCVEVHGCARTVQVVTDGHVVAEHPRHTRERIVIDPAHFEGEATATVLPPIPLGRMGRRLQEIAQLPPQQRPLDLYAALAEVAR